MLEKNPVLLGTVCTLFFLFFFSITLYTVFQEESKTNMPEIFDTEVNKRIQTRTRNNIDLISSSNEAARTCS